MNFAALSTRLKALRPLHESALAGQLPTGRITLALSGTRLDSPRTRLPGIWTDEPTRCVLSHWERAQEAMGGEMDRAALDACEVSVGRLEMVGEWWAELKTI